MFLGKQLIVNTQLHTQNGTTIKKIHHSLPVLSNLWKDITINSINASLLTISQNENIYLY